jgi:uncharacterized protein (DUF305 family)
MVFGRLGWPVFVIAAALLLVSCGGGGAGSSQQGGNGGSQDSQGGNASGMQGMDHGETQGGGGGGMAGMEGMDHGSMGSAAMAQQMVMEDGRYSDRAFIDAMVPHHQGAVEMAEVALDNAEHQQIRDLAQDIVTAQEAEIEELKSIKKEQYGTSKVPMGMSAQEMQMMGMTDPDALANRDPFDKAFIDAMIPHHQSAIAMANVALEASKNPQIRQIAEDIVSAQEREISQLQRWRQQWYPEG